jgi:hypothetical protein
VTVANVNDIYNDGTYLRNNPDAHVSDSFFKFSQLLPLLEKIPTRNRTLSILDIGGGAGVVGHLASLYFHHRGFDVKTTAADVSTSMLDLQKANNPFITKVVAGDTVAAFAGGCRYDLALAIDVFEHMPDYRPALEAIQKGSTWLVCNMPIERNLFDFLRNVYMKDRYYSEQTRSIGHLHFFSYWRHVHEFREYFNIVRADFSPYWRLITQVRSLDNQRQLENRLRYLELVVSRWVSTLAPWAAPWIIQGSCYSLSRSKSGSDS